MAGYPVVGVRDESGDPLVVRGDGLNVSAPVIGGIEKAQVQCPQTPTR
jgi:hypothetical protein